ncbi:VIT1/CCC1 transporter family protein [Mangrovibacterium marinum]|uniref:VIT1/CCC1 transporter family protein n=1 Tax=Mangrovibacterium marinum TaxID=1639118 RepID=UPI002A18BD0B|nr:VIT1/CCC1 transporter family protein [Mangrovibacterium marinum]
MERKSLSPETRKQLIIAQRNEITEYHIYSRLAQKTKDPENAETLQKIAEDELRHYHIWKKYTDREVEPSQWEISKFYWIARLFGLTFGVKLMEKAENSAKVNYAEIGQEIPEATKIGQEETEHENQLIAMIKEEKLEYIGSIVLGLNDALVEILGTLAGLTFALQNTTLVALAGIIAGISGALSMSSSEYLSHKSEGNHEGALKSAFWTGLAYIVAVVFLVVPYLVFSSPFMALIASVIDSVFVVLVYSYYISVANDQPFRKRFGEMVALSTVVGLISFGLGYLVRILFNIDI